MKLTPRILLLSILFLGSTLFFRSSLLYAPPVASTRYHFDTWALTPAQSSSLSAIGRNVFRNYSFIDPSISDSVLVERFLSRIYFENPNDMNHARMQALRAQLQGKTLDIYERNLLNLVNQGLDQTAITLEFRPDITSGLADEKVLANGDLYRNELPHQMEPDTINTGRTRILLGRGGSFIGTTPPGTSRPLTIWDEYVHELGHYDIFLRAYLGGDDLFGQIKAGDGPRAVWGGRSIDVSIGTYANEIHANLWMYRGNLRDARFFTEGADGTLGGTYYQLEAWMGDVYADIPSDMVASLRNGIRSLSDWQMFAFGQLMGTIAMMRSPDSIDYSVIMDQLRRVTNLADGANPPSLPSTYSQDLLAALTAQLDPNEVISFQNGTLDPIINFRGSRVAISTHVRTYLKDLGWKLGTVGRNLLDLFLQRGVKANTYFNLVSSPEFSEFHGYARIQGGGSSYLFSTFQDAIEAGTMPVMDYPAMRNHLLTKIRPEIRETILDYTYGDASTQRWLAARRAADAQRYKFIDPSRTAMYDAIIQINSGANPPADPTPIDPSGATGKSILQCIISF